MGWGLLQGRRAVEPAYRGLGARDRVGPAAGCHPLSRAPRPGVAWRRSYRVRVFTGNLELIEESAESRAREFRAGPDSLRRFPAGGQMLWQVEARLPGEAITVSPTFSIRVP